VDNEDDLWAAFADARAMAQRLGIRASDWLDELVDEDPSAEVLADDSPKDAPDLPHACSDFEVRRG
jgi:hypothetical protein